MALAEADQAAEGVLEEVIVTGVKYSMTEAVAVKRGSMEIVDAIVAEDLGKFPDNNVVEAMQRIPGVQVTIRSGGEVTSVSIRGFSNVTTTGNGCNIFSSSGRQVALADIPATLAFDRETFSTRLSYFWREGFQDRNEAALFANPLAIWKSPEKSLDFQATWMISERWTLTFDATNLTEEVFHENYGNQPVIFNFLNNFYSRTFALGVRFQL